ncbi:hypothetical protein ABC733_06740 [Mangrovibacter sp. SLW1]
MNKAKNHHIHSTVTPLIDAYVSKTLEQEGYTTSMIMICTVDEENRVSLNYVDDGYDFGTYQFYKKGDVVFVADYFDADDVLCSYHVNSDFEKFDDDFDLIPGLTHISEMLDILEEHGAYMYVGFDSMYISHSELMHREGWTDRKIKTTFGKIEHHELDKCKFYPLNEVMNTEKSWK